jgi:hypothetical protein
VTGVLDEDLRAAALAALELSPDACRTHALRHSWSAATAQFLANLACQPPAHATDPIPAA